MQFKSKAEISTAKLLFSINFHQVFKVAINQTAFIACTSERQKQK